MSEQPPRKRRIVLCMGQFCNQSGRAQPLYDRLQQELCDPGPAFMSRGKTITGETATCLSMCGAGPNLILYPDDIDFNHLTPEKLEAFIQEYIRKPPESR